MPGRRYPRPGQRLAPRLLSEVLNAAVPAKYADSVNGKFARLCDLDERVWQFLDIQSCKALAGEVVLAVGRAARQPAPFTALQLPPIPSGVTLADLDLESRTYNCLAAIGIEERPQDLGRMTIESVLSLRGFWSKCLVDLLTSIEFATDHPDLRQKTRRPRVAGARHRKTFGRYPRRGYRLAPALLREILDVPVPGREISNPAVRGRNLCDLDESVSRGLTDDELVLLGRAIVARVNVSSHRRTIRELPLPAPPRGIRLQDLALENRTYNCLAREGLGSSLEDLAKYTVGDLLSLKAFGAKCLLDLLTSLETAMASSDSLDEKLTEEAVALGRMPEASRIHFSDPRLGTFLRSIDTEADTMAELASRVVRRRVDPPDSPAQAKQLADIRHRIHELDEMALGLELAEIFAPQSHRRDREIISEYYGWDGGGGRTLEELGNRYGLSRERIRQVCMRAAKRHLQANVFAPALDQAVDFIVAHSPISVDRLKNAFEAAGLQRLWLPPGVVRKAAGFLSRDVAFETVSVGEAELVVDQRSVSSVRAIAQHARRVALASGIATVSDVIQQMEQRQSIHAEPELVRVVLETLPHFQWLDDERAWFHLDSGASYGLPNMMDKVFSVCPEIDVSRLRAALERHRRSGRKVPPGRVLLAFCSQNPAVTVSGRTVICESPPSVADALSGVEAEMVQILREHGPVLERGTFEEHCLKKGMNRFSFNATLMASPVIVQLGRSVYGLVGTTISRKRAQALSAKQAANASTRVLRGFGELADGRVYLSYRLSKAAIAGGVTTVPASLKDRLQGSYAIRTADGTEAGQLVARGGCAWGLGPALRSQHARPGDDMVILVDPGRELADVYLGERDLLDTLVASLSLQLADACETEKLTAVSDG